VGGYVLRYSVRILGRQLAGINEVSTLTAAFFIFQTEPLLLTSKIITRKLLIGVSVLLVFHLLTLFVKFGLGHLSFHGMIIMFSFDDERNVPTLYSGILILLCAVMLWKVARSQRELESGLSFYWKALCAVTIFLFFDEAFSIHEIANHKMFKGIWPEGNGYFHFAWVIPYFFLGTAVLLFFSRFLMRLPYKTRVQFISAGLIYAGGALGMELLGGKYKSSYGLNLNYFLIITVEELLEMLGMVKFFDAIMNHFLSNSKKERLELKVALLNDRVSN
jgi:hypothetical protein